MKRIYEARAYETPQACWWDQTAPTPSFAPLDGDLRVDVVIIGGGFTGMNAALALADAGASVAVIDAQQPGWGASRRNGGFCCLGGSKASDASLARRFGQAQLSEWRAAERAAVDHVAALITENGIDADTHSNGETLLAHNAKAMSMLRAERDVLHPTYGVEPDVFEAKDLERLGLNGRFYGGMTLPIGFALNPAKYHDGLTRAASNKGAKIFGATPATAITQIEGGWCVEAPSGHIHADKVVLATNGYSSEDVPQWLRARYLPVQSSIIVTRPITAEQQARQGWTSTQMCYDTRLLLHYFRLMPDGRFLFGMRGGLKATASAEAHLSRKIRSNFHNLFPSWKDIEITHEWSGLVCVMRSLTPFAGPVPDMPGVYASLGYHGNGVAMGSYLGARLADAVLGRKPLGPFPKFLSAPPKRFPLGTLRRGLLAPAYAAAAVFDR